jgi:hypothetical protein
MTARGLLAMSLLVLYGIMVGTIAGLSEVVREQFLLPALVFHGVLVTYPAYLLTGWNCSGMLAVGHGPSCEIGITAIFVTAAMVWALAYLVRMQIE